MQPGDIVVATMSGGQWQLHVEVQPRPPRAVWVRYATRVPDTTPSKHVPSRKIRLPQAQLFTNVHQYWPKRSPLLTCTLTTVQYRFGEER